MNRCVLIIIAAVLVGSIAEVESDEPLTSAQVLAQARLYQYQYRVGRTELAQKSVALLEEAIKRDPRNAEVWNALGVAHFLSANAVTQANGSPKDLLINAEHAKGAYEQALKLDPDDPNALAGRGMARTLLANRRHLSQDIRAGVADLNRAIELDPGLVPIRLMRAFTTVNLQPEFRSIESIADDFEYLITVSGGNRATDVLRVLLGDAYLDAKDAVNARRQYSAAGAATSYAGEQARARLRLMEQGGSIDAEAMKLRKNLAQCTMCHGG